MRDIQKDIIAKANDIRELEGDVGLVWDPQVIHKCLQDRVPEKTKSGSNHFHWQLIKVNILTYR